MEFHKIASIFPLVEGDELDRLVDDIKINGLLEPIILCENKILDGRNRYNACLKAEREPCFTEYTGDNPLSFVISKNLHRRHLNESQRALVAAKLANMRQGERTDLVEPSANLPKVSQSEAAELLNVSERSLRSAKVIEQEAPELLTAIQEGRITVGKAIKNLERDKRMETEKNARLEAIADIEIRRGDFKEVLSDLYNIDAIITDPPYPHEFINCFSELGEYASTHLKEDGFCAVYSGQYHLPEVIARLSEYLTYVWTFCLRHTNAQIVNGINVMCGWKPVLVFSRGKKKFRYSTLDVLASGQREKFAHEWQQAEGQAVELVDLLTMPGELVVDPFSGSGTFVKVAHELGRRAIGAEIKEIW